MTWVRLGDKIIDSETFDDPVITIDNLAQRVLFPEAMENISNVPSYYVQSRSLSDSEIGVQLGNYERLLLGKFLKPPNSILCISGIMGSGKTTVIRYLAQEIQSFCSNYPEQLASIIAYIDFNEDPMIQSTLNNAFNEREVADTIYGILIDEINVKITDEITEEDEYIHFWNHEINNYRNSQSSPASFRRLLTELKKDYRNTEVNQNTLQDFVIKRKKVLKKHLIKLNEKMDYYLRLWRFSLKRSPVSKVSLIILDNLDRLHPTIQQKIFEIVTNHKRTGGPTFVLPMRPETRNKSGLATGLIDEIDHRGPTPKRIIMRRIREFIRKPESFFNSQDGISRDEFQMATTFISKIYRNCFGQNSEFDRFIHFASGESIRTGLLLAQSIFHASPHQMRKETVKCRELVRLTISGSSKQLNWSRNHPVEHAFRTTDQSEICYLLKPRILFYMMRHPRNTRRLQEVAQAMRDFGYSKLDIKNALHDLMAFPSQIIRSTGFDFYFEEDPFEKHYRDNLKVTEVGVNYIEKIMFDFDYFQEIILDTFVPANNFGSRYGFLYLEEKLNLIYHFMHELMQEDKERVIYFLARVSLERYFDVFGDELISYQIAAQFFAKIRGILLSIEKSSGDELRIEGLKNLRERYASLIITMKNENMKLLGVYPKD